MTCESSSVEDELVVNFLDIDKQLISTETALKSMDLKSRLSFGMQALAQEDRNAFLRNYVTRAFLGAVLDELEFLVERFDLHLKVVSHVYDFFELFVRRSSKLVREEGRNSDAVSINVFHMNRELSGNKKFVNDDDEPKVTRSKNVQILTPRIERINNGGKKEKEEEADLDGRQHVNGSTKQTVREAKVFLKRLEFYFGWLKLNETSLKNGEKLSALKADLATAKEDFETESALLEVDKKFFNKNLDKLRSSQNKNAKLIEEI